jgi:hypothetical protein
LTEIHVVPLKHEGEQMTTAHQVEHLLLLVGSNPLPNAVAGRLLVQSGGLISLLHSAETLGTAQRLKAWLEHGESGVTAHLKQVAEANPVSIYDGVNERLEAGARQSVGLNYTGGTKAMSVHAYRTLERWAAQKRIRAVFSYLDARTLRMVYDPASPESGESPHLDPVACEICVQLKELLQMHGWSLKHDPTVKPTLPKTAEALAQAQKEGSSAWTAWIRTELEEKCRPVDRQKWCFRERDRRNLKGKELEALKDRCKRPDRQSDWAGDNLLDKVELQLPVDPPLQRVAAALREDLDLAGAVIPLSQCAGKGGFGKSEHLCEWLHGKWLEHAVLRTFNEIAEPVHLHECAQNIETSEVQFDVDVIALRGYQMFAVSCSTDSTKGLLKSKLFEAYIRARQLGGDEACTALVSCSDNPETLEREMRRDLHVQERLRVFGRNHLVDLKAHLTDWIQSQTGEK